MYRQNIGILIKTKLVIMKIKILFVGALLVSLCFAFINVDTQTDWVVPPKYKNMKNPVKTDAASLKIGKTLYAKECRSCHGKEGLGDGTKAAQLETPSGDFSLNGFQSQSDGSLFYKTIEGRGDMPGFRKKMPYDEDVWHVVNYLRTFAE